MEFEEVIKRRKSTREFLSKEIEEEKIEKVLEIMNTAPSAGNLQAYKVFLVKNEQIKKEIARACLEQMFIAQAPVVLVFCALPTVSAQRYGERGKNLYALQDATLAASFAWLAGVSQGLSAVWVGGFNEEKLKRILNLKEEKPIAVMPMGYSLAIPRATSRKDLKELIEEIE